MSDFKRISFNVDAATGRQIDLNGSVVRESAWMRLLFDDKVILCLNYYDVTLVGGKNVVTPRPLPAGMAFMAFADSDFLASTAFMFQVCADAQNLDGDGVNDPGDWVDGGAADPTKGQLSFRVSTDTDRFLAAVNGGKNWYFVVTGIPAGETAESVLAYFPFAAENRPSSSSGAPVSNVDNYLTAVQVSALVSGLQAQLDAKADKVGSNDIEIDTATAGVVLRLGEKRVRLVLTEPETDVFAVDFVKLT